MSDLSTLSVSISAPQHVLDALKLEAADYNRSVQDLVTSIILQHAVGLITERQHKEDLRARKGKKKAPSPSPSKYSIFPD